MFLLLDELPSSDDTALCIPSQSTPGSVMNARAMHYHHRAMKGQYERRQKIAEHDLLNASLAILARPAVTL